MAFRSGQPKSLASINVNSSSNNNSCCGSISLNNKRRYSWPSAERSLRPSQSGIFEPLPDTDQIIFRTDFQWRKPLRSKLASQILASYASEDADSGLAQGSSIDMDENASSGSAAAVVMAELLEGASLGSLEQNSGSGPNSPSGSASHSSSRRPKSASGGGSRKRRLSRAALLNALGTGALFNGPFAPEDEPNSAGASGFVSARTARKRRIAGIFQHYYPEGDWGYLILLCGFLVTLLTHGLQTSLSAVIFPLSSLRFHVQNDVIIGKKSCLHLGFVLITKLCAVLPH